MVTTAYQDAVQFRSDRFNPIILAESDKTRVMLVCFQPGQFIPVHSPPVDLTIAVLEGEGELIAGDERSTMTPGTLAFIPAGEARGINAATQFVALLTVTPPPTEADHREVKAGLSVVREV